MSEAKRRIQKQTFRSSWRSSWPINVFFFLLGSTVDHEPYDENDKSLVPCFVFHGKKPNYGKIFKKSTMILESLDIRLGNWATLITFSRFKFDKPEDAVITVKSNW